MLFNVQILKLQENPVDTSVLSTARVVVSFIAGEIVSGSWLNSGRCKRALVVWIDLKIIGSYVDASK